MDRNTKIERDILEMNLKIGSLNSKNITFSVITDDINTIPQMPLSKDHYFLVKTNLFVLGNVKNNYHITIINLSKTLTPVEIDIVKTRLVPIQVVVEDEIITRLIPEQTIEKATAYEQIEISTITSQDVLLLNEYMLMPLVTSFDVKTSRNFICLDGILQEIP